MPVTVNGLFYWVKITYFCVVSFAKETAIYVNLRELSYFSAQNLEHLFNPIGINSIWDRNSFKKA